MSPNPIVLLGSGADPQIQRVGACLAAVDAPFAVWDATSFPQTESLSFDARGPRFSVPLDAPPAAAYVRGLKTSPLSSSFHDELLARPRGLVAQCEEKRALLEPVLLYLEDTGCRMVNTIAANAIHGRKPWQLSVLGRAGLPTPRWIATNDPDSARTFFDAVGDVVYKPLAGGAAVRLLEAKDKAPERLELLRNAPVLFEEYVPGLALRVFVVDAKAVAAASIASTEIDYRLAEGEVRATALSTEEREIALHAARTCQMPFSGVDLIRGAAGRVCLLECNPSPMFAVFEEKTGCDVAGPLAAYLVHAAAQR
ncbi:MAG: hypothetical protein HYV27_24145 [Candidatus Hydrogenedentes bacterium]|nr:hypothetical protein [Candidatus Hydrogenedentota bacterium]